MQVPQKTLLLSAIGMLLLVAAPVLIAQGNSQEHVPGRLLVQRLPEIPDAAISRAVAAAGARVEREIGDIHTLVLRVPEAASDRVANALLRSGLFTFVEPDYVAHSAAVTPNDPDFSNQWHLTKISAPAGWGITPGSATVPIAIIDSGIQLTHPDLAAKVLPGWNFVTNTSNTADDLGHGTAVSGTAAASTNNLSGVAGVAWANPIMPVVVLDSTNYASYSNIASAINYAANQGVRIINISIGGSSASSTLQSAVNYAWSKGAVIFASAMNNGSTTPYYPAACQYVVAVSATDQNDNLASFSNYGSWITLSAPGTYILTTQQSSSYGLWQGTSFAAPIAAAAGALVLSRQPSLSASGLVALLEQNSDPLPAGTTGWNQKFGWGRINVYKALSAAVSTTSSTQTQPPSVSISSPGSSSTVSGTIAVQGSASGSLAISSIQLLVDGQLVATSTSSPFSFSWSTTGAANGSHTITVQAYDTANDVGSASVAVTVSNTIVSDTTPPVVTITKPINGAKVTGNVTIAASATDNVGVAHVSIYVDGVQLCSDTAVPYTCNWNTKKAFSGIHTITANAWDAAGNKGSATPLQVTK